MFPAEHFQGCNYRFPFVWKRLAAATAEAHIVCGDLSAAKGEPDQLRILQTCVTWVQIIMHQLCVEVPFITVWRKCLFLILMIIEINLKKRKASISFFFQLFFSPYFSALFHIRKLKKLAVLNKLCMFLFMLSYISLVQLWFSCSSGLSMREYICTDTVVPWAEVL